MSDNSTVSSVGVDTRPLSEKLDSIAQRGVEATLPPIWGTGQVAVSRGDTHLWVTYVR